MTFNYVLERRELNESFNLKSISKASVIVNEHIVSEIKNGFLIFICAMAEDEESEAKKNGI